MDKNGQEPPTTITHCDECHTWTYCELDAGNWFCKNCRRFFFYCREIKTLKEEPPTMESLDALFDELILKAKELEELIKQNRIKNWEGFARSLLSIPKKEG